MNFLFENKALSAVLFVSLAIVVKQVFFTKKPKSSPTKQVTSPTEEPPKKPIVVDNGVISSAEYRPFKLIKKVQLTKGENVLAPVTLYRFEIPDKTKSLGLPTGQHIWLRTTVKNENGEEEEVRRSYTPTSSNDDIGFFDLVIKVYGKGKMSQFVDQLTIGSTIDVLGPKGRFVYEKNRFKNIGMLAGGTGITPMLQVIEEVLKHKDDRTKMILLYGNLTEDDIILREKIDELAQDERFDVFHVLNEPPSGWTMGKGFISKDMIQEKFAPAGEGNTALMCGPPGMMKAMKGHLTLLGYGKDSIFSF